jgi:DNA-binding ferritin-like protein
MDDPSLSTGRAWRPHDGIRRRSTSLRENPNDPVVKALSTLLADTYTLYLKTHNYHWNVTGPMFNTLHTL